MEKSTFIEFIDKLVQGAAQLRIHRLFRSPDRTSHQVIDSNLLAVVIDVHVPTRMVGARKLEYVPLDFSPHDSAPMIMATA